MKMRRFLAALGVSLISGTSWGIVVNADSTATNNPAANETAPVNGAPWANVGWLSFGTAASDPGTGVYLGNGWFITANHNPNVTGITLFTDDPSGGTTYPTISSVQLTNPFPGTGNADLRLYQIASSPALPSLAIADVSPVLSQQITMIGTGRERGSNLQNIPVSSGTVPGYYWAATRDKTWATNTVEVTTSMVGAFNTFAYLSDFDAVGDGQATDKDSGGGAFYFDAVDNRWELSGIMIGITGYSGQPSNASLGGQGTYFADLSYYSSQINAIVPEPSAALLLVLGAGGLMIRRRHVA